MHVWSTSRYRFVAVASLAALTALATFDSRAAANETNAAPAIADAQFGVPPSGEVPILFNDHTVYATPDLLKRSRVLAALVRGHQIYVPLRSMFEQMGATVSASADGKTITASKPGADVSVTLGKSEVVINGESRPLDVPPMLYRGVVVVPVRVISEALGAYVQWVPEKRVVVVRYFATPPTAPPASPTPAPVVTAAPIVIPTVAPTAMPTAVPTQTSYTAFVAGAIAAPKTYNEFSGGHYCPRSFLVNGALLLKNSPLALKVDYRQDAYVTSDNITDSLANHYTQFATIDGGVAFTPVFLARQSSLDARLEFEIAPKHFNLGVGYLHTATNYGYPALNAIGFGAEKLPDLHPGLGLFGSAFYYPSASGNYTVSNATSPNAGKTYRQQYGIVKYDVGLALVFAHSPLYLHGGFGGDRFIVKSNAPINQTHDGPYVGLGIKI